VPYALTDRELNVLRLIAAGRTNAQIGAELHVSTKTPACTSAKPKVLAGETTYLVASNPARLPDPDRIPAQHPRNRAPATHPRRPAMIPIGIQQLARAQNAELARVAERRWLAAAAKPGSRRAAASIRLTGRLLEISLRPWIGLPGRDRGQPGRPGQRRPLRDVAESVLLRDRLGSPQ
jgi:hypothetical protein